MAMGEPHDEQLSTTLPQREHLFLHSIKNVSLCSQLESNLQIKINWIKTKWTQGIQPANIYPNLIALSALVEKKDAKVRVDVRYFCSLEGKKTINWVQVSMPNSGQLLSYTFTIYRLQVGMRRIWVQLPFQVELSVGIVSWSSGHLKQIEQTSQCHCEGTDSDSSSSWKSCPFWRLHLCSMIASPI